MEFAEMPQPQHQPQSQPQPHIERDSGSSLPLQQASASFFFSLLTSTGVRMLQLNMRRSALITGEMRQLIVEEELDVLLLQEPHFKKQGSSHTFVGLGMGMKVAAVRLQRPWAAVAVCNPKFQIMFVS
ncbi:fibrocystin [Lasius niger]|uniref:Fibrocystin n=1 Tax=Lasius niger TaxID=67767 RepID=A0A0J7KPF2_LASNI|nr:fibrocystin [Lasius niger]